MQLLLLMLQCKIISYAVIILRRLLADTENSFTKNGQVVPFGRPLQLFPLLFLYFETFFHGMVVNDGTIHIYNGGVIPTAIGVLQDVFPSFGVIQMMSLTNFLQFDYFAMSSNIRNRYRIRQQ